MLPECHQSLDSTISNAPDHLMVQSFWSTSDVPFGVVWDSIKGIFGIPIYLFSYVVENEGKKETTENLIPDDVTFWQVFDDIVAEEESKPKCRIHVLEAFEGGVKPLSHSQGPRELLEGILHTILGHWNILEAGYVHYNINDKNILMLNDPKELPAVEVFEPSKNLTLCKAVIAGASQAPRLGEEVNGLQSHPPTFYALRLSTGSALGRHARMQPTALDALESFYFVFIFVLLDKIQSRGGKLREIEERVFNVLTSEDVPSANVAKYGIPHVFSGDSDGSRVMDNLGCILKPWSSLVSHYRSELWLKTTEHLEKEFVHAAYESYLKSGFEVLDKLPDSWNDCV